MKNKIFHITARTQNDLYFQKPVSEVWTECLKKLEFAYRSVPSDIMAIVLMNNHYHLLLKIDPYNIHKFLELFSPSYLSHYKYELIISYKYLKHAYKYIYRNPIRANLVRRVEHYPYSSINYLYNGKSMPFVVVDKFGITDEYKLKWLNSLQSNLYN